MKEEIQLGDKVRCIHTGFTGTAVVKSEFLNGCIQYSVLPKLNKKSKSLNEGIMPEEVSIDSQSLEIIKPKKKTSIKKERNGGATRRGVLQRGY